MTDRRLATIHTADFRSWHIALLRCYAAIRRLSRYSGLWRGVSLADLWFHGLVKSRDRS